MQKNSNFENFESALYSTSGSMPLTNGSIHAHFFIVCCRGHQSILKFVCVGGGVICERSVCGVQGAGPWWGLQGDSAPLPEKILYLMGIRCNSIPHFGKNTKLLRKKHG